MTAFLPDATLVNHIGILGKTGSGKSNTAKVAAERIMAAGGRVCIVDPTGTWWGIRLTPDGKKQSRFKPVIFGGSRADIQIAAEHGAVVGEAIATASSSAIIDTRLLTVGARTRFFTAFAETLVRFNKGPLHLIIDEAHLFMPQGKVNDPQSGAMLHAGNNLVSLGRGLGLRIMLISQRPAKLHKDSLTQVETLVAMRVIHNLDVDAVRTWIGQWADVEKGKEIVASLPSLPTGTAWVWAPEISFLERMKFPLAATFDSGKPPSLGEAAPNLAPINIEEIGTKLDSIRNEAQANDPVRLKRRIAELERAASNPVAKMNTPDPQAIEKARQTGYDEGFKVGRNVGYGQASRTQMMRVADALAGAALLVGVTDAFNEAGSKIKAIEIEGDAGSARGKPADFGSATAGSNPAPAATSPVRPLKRPDTIAPKTEVSGLGAERKPLSVLVAAFPAGYTDAQWASLAGFKRTGGTWGTYKSRLRTKGMVFERQDGLWFASEEGIDAIGGDAAQIPSDPDGLLAMWKSKVSGVGPMLDTLRGVYPSALSRDEIAEAVSLTASGGTFGTYLSRLRTNGLIEENGSMVRISPAIMGDA